MNIKRLITNASVTFLMISGVQAQTQVGSVNTFYGEVGLSPVEVSGAGGDARPFAVRLLVGNELTKNLGLDLMYTATISKDSRSGYNAYFNGLGLFVKPKVALTEGTEVFARLGVLRSDITASAAGRDLGTDIAYGVGIQTYFTKTVYGQFDYMHSYDRDNVAAKGFTVSAGTRF